MEVRSSEMMKSTLYFFGVAEAPSVSQANAKMSWINGNVLFMRPFSRNGRDSQAMISRASRDPILPMFSLCLSDVGEWDSSFQLISVFFVGIGENSGIEMRILYNPLFPR